MFVFSCSLSAPSGLFAKKQRISYSPQKGCNVTHFAMFDWRRVPIPLIYHHVPLGKKRHLQLTESVEFSWKPPYPFWQFSILFHGSGGGTPSFSALWSSWNLGHPRPLGGRRVRRILEGRCQAALIFFLRKNTPCSTEWYYYRRKFRSETSDNMDSWKAEVRRVRREKIRRKKMQMREKVGKSRFTVFFQWFVAPEGRKVGSLKRRVRTQLARWEMKKCTPLWPEAHFQVKMYKTHHSRTTFWSSDVEKVHAVVARSTFPSQNVQNTPGSDHFWKLRCRKSARRCGAKHISKSKCTKHHMLGPLLEVQMSKKCRKSARRCGAKHISKSNV